MGNTILLFCTFQEMFEHNPKGKVMRKDGKTLRINTHRRNSDSVILPITMQVEGKQRLFWRVHEKHGIEQEPHNRALYSVHISMSKKQPLGNSQYRLQFIRSINILICILAYPSLSLQQPFNIVNAFCKL